MATKACFLTNQQTPFEEKIVSFTYVKGLAFSQKQKNVLSFHSSIQKLYPSHRLLEVSTKSNDPLGVQLSAFNLKLDDVPLECVFQSSKVFENNVQYDFLVSYPPKEAKQFIAKESHGKLTCFRYNGETFPLIPPSLFYDYIYILALSRIPLLSAQLANYDIFTDIEFNEKKQINCQARSCAIYSHLLRTNTQDYYLASIEHFKELYSTTEQEQLSLF